MTRKDLLQGMVKGVHGKELTIQTEWSLKDFKPGQGILFCSKPDYCPATVDPGEVLYNAQGQPIALVTKVETRGPVYDTTRKNNEIPRYTTGNLEAKITAVPFQG
jgi:hypothetical protein